MKVYVLSFFVERTDRRGKICDDVCGAHWNRFSNTMGDGSTHVMVSQ